MNKHLRVLVYLFILTNLYTGTLFAATKATVKWTYVNLREIPSRRAEIITKLVKGVSVTVLDEEDEWYKVTTEEEIVGWLVKESVKVTKAVEKKGDTKENAVESAEKNFAASAITEKTIKSDTNNDKRQEKKETGQKKAKESYIKGSDQGDIETLKTPSATVAFLKMITSTLIILGILLFLYYIVNKYSSKSPLDFEGSNAITILASKHIGQKTVLHIIDLMEKIVVIAINGSDIKVITEIEDSAAVDRMRDLTTKLKENEKPFKRFFTDEVNSSSGSNLKTKDENFDLLDDLNEKIKKKTDELGF